MIGQLKPGLTGFQLPHLSLRTHKGMRFLGDSYEMLDPDAPAVLQQWIAKPPSWLTVQTVSIIDTTLSSLDPGEQAAISLAQALPADLLIIDERMGRQIAEERGIAIIGTLGILDDAADQGLINLAEVIAQLQQTNFRVSHRLIQALLNKPKN